MEYKLDPTSSVPLHQQAEDLLRQMIQQEEYRQGKLLPNEVEFAKTLNISRNTLRQAINKLVYEGLLIRKKSVGTQVAPARFLGNATKWMSFSQEMRTLGIEVENFELHVTRKKGTTEACDFFKCTADERMLCLERLRGRPNLPFVYFISYFNPSLPLSGEEDFTQPLYETLDKKYDIIVKTSREFISAAAATPQLAEKLDLNEGDPILVRKRYVLDINDKPIEYNIGYYRADSFVYSIEFTNNI